MWGIWLERGPSLSRVSYNNNNDNGNDNDHNNNDTNDINENTNNISNNNNNDDDNDNNNHENNIKILNQIRKYNKIKSCIKLVFRKIYYLV